jgi:hypothetical protein
MSDLSGKTTEELLMYAFAADDPQNSPALLILYEAKEQASTWSHWHFESGEEHLFSTSAIGAAFDSIERKIEVATELLRRHGMKPEPAPAKDE